MSRPCATGAKLMLRQEWDAVERHARRCLRCQNFGYAEARRIAQEYDETAGGKRQREAKNGVVLQFKPR